MSKQDITNKLTKWTERGFGGFAVVIILGLASKGAATYLTNMSSTQQDVISIAGVVTLAWLSFKAIQSIVK